MTLIGLTMPPDQPDSTLLLLLFPGRGISEPAPPSSPQEPSEIPEDQRRFVAQVRGVLADGIERGEPVQPVRLRERAERRLVEDLERVR